MEYSQYMASGALTVDESPSTKANGVLAVHGDSIHYVQ